MTRKATYDKMTEYLTTALSDFDILCGNSVADSNVTWRDVAGTCAVNLRLLADQLEQCREGNCEPFISFPCPHECLDSIGK